MWSLAGCLYSALGGQLFKNLGRELTASFSSDTNQRCAGLAQEFASLSSPVFTKLLHVIKASVIKCFKGDVPYSPCLLGLENRDICFVLNWDFTVRIGTSIVHGCAFARHTLPIMVSPSTLEAGELS